MKGFLAVCVIAITVSSAFAVDDAMKKKLEDTFRKCKESNPITDEEVQQIKKHEAVPSSPQAKCLAKCMMEEGKLMKDGKYNKDAAMAFAEALHNDEPEEVEKVKKVIEHCLAEVGADVGSDECEYAYKMTSCGHAKAKELGVKKVDWE
ncbi:hypothetical protein O3M35_000363 [Rhynocoris fuscipes]|uniref:Uncharacterized protein n=1 Tax=Rhynocoris fuscipes TaxID=488301 RepID=A0AAW1DMB8_9HEMI